jgi:signal transduction histidine kinase
VRISCDPAAVVRTRTSFWAVLMEDQGRPFVVEVTPSPDPVRVTEHDLGAALDALLQNALLHTPDGTAVRVQVRPVADGCTELVVSDEGPGFPAGADARGVSTAGSTGLGLDIARRTAEASGGRAVVGRTHEGGASVTLVLGPAL